MSCWRRTSRTSAGAEPCYSAPFPWTLWLSRSWSAPSPSATGPLSTRERLTNRSNILNDQVFHVSFSFVHFRMIWKAKLLQWNEREDSPAPEDTDYFLETLRGAGGVSSHRNNPIIWLRRSSLYSRPPFQSSSWFVVLLFELARWVSYYAFFVQLSLHLILISAYVIKTMLRDILVGARPFLRI